MDSILDPIFQHQIDTEKLAGVAAIALGVSGNVLYRNAFGQATIGDSTSPKVTTASPSIIYSCTKLVTSVALLQLVEQGKVSIHDPVEKYVPEIKDIQVFQGFDNNDEPKFTAPKSKPLVLHLLTHTSGFNYDFFDQASVDYKTRRNLLIGGYSLRSSFEDYSPPLFYEPGSRYSYGVSTDWVGFVVERVSGLRLDAYIAKHVTEPLGLTRTGAHMTAEMEKEYLSIHFRTPDGKLVPTPIRHLEDPPIYAGGHCLYSTVEDYAQFLLTLLNNGTHPTSKVTILKPESVKEYLFKNWIPQGCSTAAIGEIVSADPKATSEGTFLPTSPKSWSLGLMLNAEALPNGRNKNSGAWAGLANSYYWLDPTAGKLGFLVSPVLPFMDKEVLYLFDALERAVYGKPQAKALGEKGSNFAVPAEAAAKV